MRIELDGHLLTNRDAVHNQIAEKLHFPEYYGRNLDALYDLLSVYPQSLEIAVTHSTELVSSLGAYGAALLATLQDASEENPLLTLIQQ